MTPTPTAPGPAVAEAVARAIFEFEEHRICEQDRELNPLVKEQAWEDAHPLDHDEYMEKAHAAIHAYETAKAAHS